MIETRPSGSVLPDKGKVVGGRGGRTQKKV